jgi:hypothetical protein
MRRDQRAALKSDVSPSPNMSISVPGPLTMPPGGAIVPLKLFIARVERSARRWGDVSLAKERARWSRQQEVGSGISGSRTREAPEGQVGVLWSGLGPVGEGLQLVWPPAAQIRLGTAHIRAENNKATNGSSQPAVRHI